jgi:LysM repeat protein
LDHLLRRSDGLPRKINMLCHSAMLAAFQATEKKVSVKTAKKIAAAYHDSVSITKPRSGRRLLAMPALVMGAGLAALLFLGLVHPNAWSNWFYHSPSSVQQVEPAAHPVRALVRVKTVEQRGVKGHQQFGGKLKTAPYVAPRPVELPASVATPVVALAETGNDVPVRTTNSTVPARSAGIQKRTEVPAAQEQRGSVTIRYGDTLESIAIRYFGSKAGINELIQANPQLTNINQLSVGQVIYLPPGVPHKPSQDQTATALPIPNADSGNR